MGEEYEEKLNVLMQSFIQKEIITGQSKSLDWANGADFGPKSRDN